ncbi:subtilisin-like protease 4 [Corylus avellana]|uniref:subtilisin-like protease 4 n=1 Tax=Corylus avellana TaxID=13451 RepID=UPI00286AE230|nr:subtilisin-like protease 4 [Corylus avellana]
MENSDDIESWYASFLPDDDLNNSEREEEEEQEPRMVYSYRNVVSGFAARLTAEEVKAMETKDGFISARPERILQLQTTYTPEFMGLKKTDRQVGFWENSNFGKGMIIGILDSGILPTHPSFSDQGMLPPPVRWKGTCDFNGTNCNNKIIGAKVFHAGKKVTAPGPFDDEGHGTHVASIAAGNFVNDANSFGNARGTAAGIAPHAHLAIYKVCFNNECAESDLMAGFESAIEEGVDVISISAGGGSHTYYQDYLALGAFQAIQYGILVSCAGGNNGPGRSTVQNEAPWILTVGASTVDRSIRATVKLGSGDEYDGESLFQPQDFNSNKLLRLVFPRGDGCSQNTLKDMDVEGKVVFCTPAVENDANAVLDAGGAAAIIMNSEVDGYTLDLKPTHPALPTTLISYVAGLKIKEYMNSQAYPKATILFKGTVIGDPSAPTVGAFSGRGPTIQSPGVMKPDIIGPGVNILGAWPVRIESNSNSLSTFNVISGTSMACPHLSGIAALLKSSHPDWSPAAIKSAIMTTADTLNLGENPIVDELHLFADVFTAGAGHVNPSRANDPGLVYDIRPNDYIPFLCGLNYPDQMIRIILHWQREEDIRCTNVNSIPAAQLNYPSFTVTLGLNHDNQTYTRTVTNVGPANSSYTLDVLSPNGIGGLEISPKEISFTEVKQKASYTVTFIPSNHTVRPMGYAQGYLQWVSGRYNVRSLIAVTYV